MEAALRGEEGVSKRSQHFSGKNYEYNILEIVRLLL